MDLPPEMLDSWRIQKALGQRPRNGRPGHGIITEIDAYNGHTPIERGTQYVVRLLLLSTIASREITIARCLLFPITYLHRSFMH